ncbi:SatD family protein [Arsenicicoccus dermatophilus]|uniref:SatD family protein n=1 Tax=Arsenicicoccus dermatophilus TaxID=1076331 RepID=UPI001F4C8F62|nr:SatD family protein [Arsenicicoccus dermatophilus]MCH8611890.1 SatD family protein [Arsenicicoccus dermatophilus]
MSGQQSGAALLDDAYVMLGDLVRSRAAGDRMALHETVVRALARTEALVPAVMAPTVTVGDEFQGVYATAGDAVLASLVVRLLLLPDVDARCGLGRGRVQVLDGTRTPPLQDGPAWWAARQAIEEAERRGARPATRSCRSWYAHGPGASADGEAGIRAVLVLRDEVVAALDDRARRVLLGGLSDLTQTMIAKQEGITQSAVSQIVSRGGLAAVIEAHRLLREADRPA